MFSKMVLDVHCMITPSRSRAAIVSEVGTDVHLFGDRPVRRSICNQEGLR
jgi:hypothetical protein